MVRWPALALLAGGSVLALTNCAQTPGPGASGASPATQTARLLSGEEIKSRLSGKTFAWLRARDHAAGETTFSADGQMRWKRSDVTTGGSGKWWVKEDRLCQEYAPTPDWKGGLVCRTLTANGKTLVTSPNDGGRVTFTEVAG